MRAPVIEVRVLPPPQRLERPAGLVVLEPWTGSAATAATSSDSRTGCLVVGIRIEDLEVVVIWGEALRQPRAQLVEVGSAPTSGSELSGRITSVVAPSCAPASWISETSSRSSGTVSFLPSPRASASAPSRKSGHSLRSCQQALPSPDLAPPARQENVAENQVCQTSRSLRPSNARPSVTSSAYSRSPPTGRPLAAWSPAAPSVSPAGPGTSRSPHLRGSGQWPGSAR